MKKLLLVVIILAGVGFWYIQNDSQISKNVWDEKIPGSAFHADPSSATFTFDEESVTLSKGNHANTESGEETELLEERAYGDINADTKNDTVVFITRSGGGSGTFIYAAAYVSGPVSYKGSNAIFLGDRIAPQTISINNGTVTVYYLDRGEDEPFASEPTVPSSKKFVYKNGEFQEI